MQSFVYYFKCLKWPLITEYPPLTTNHWPLTTDHWPLTTDRWPLTAAVAVDGGRRPGGGPGERLSRLADRLARRRPAPGGGGRLPPRGRHHRPLDDHRRRRRRTVPGQILGQTAADMGRGGGRDRGCAAEVWLVGGGADDDLCCSIWCELWVMWWSVRLCVTRAGHAKSELWYDVGKINSK